MKADLNDTIQLSDLGRQTLMLWVNHIPVSQAPKQMRKALASHYRHLDSVKLGISLMLQVRTDDCKSQEDVRQRACEAIDKLNACTANGTPPALAMAMYHAWAAKRGFAIASFAAKATELAIEHMTQR